jgi:citronellol/citronellal dehydrogenase
MALRIARDGANIVIAAKSVKPHPKLKGTIHDVAREVESSGGQALPVQVDVRFESQVAEMVTAAIKKFGMTMLALGMSAEFAPYNISVNCLWPRTAIATAAIEYEVGSRDIFNRCRKPEIVAAAAYEILSTPEGRLTGQTLTDEQVLMERGYRDLGRYAYNPAHVGNLLPDFFLDIE